MKTYLLTALAACSLAASSLLVLAADEDKRDIRVRAPFVAVDISIGDQTRAADDTPGRMTDLLGMAIKDTKGERLGTLADAVIGTKSGRIRYAAISLGGFLGIGDRLVAVPWESLTFQHDQQGDEMYFLLDVDRKTLDGLPRIETDKWPEHLALEKDVQSGPSSRLVPELKQDEPAENAKSNSGGS